GRSRGPARRWLRPSSDSERPSSPALVLVGPVLALPGPELLVVSDHARVPHASDQLLGEPPGCEVLDLDVELALLPDDRVDLAELGLVEYAAGVVVEPVDRLLRQ